MAKKSKNDIDVEIDANIKAGADRSITTIKDNALRKNQNASAVNMITNLDLLGLKEHTSSRSENYQQREACIKNGALFQSRSEQSGSFNEYNFIQLTPYNALNVVPVYNPSTSYSAGKIVSYDGLLFRKVGATQTGADPYDNYEFDNTPVLLPYYGFQYVVNRVYITGMVIRATIGGVVKLLRKVKPAASFDYYYSTNLTTEISAGHWVDEIDISLGMPIPIDIVDPTLSIDNDSAHNKVYYVSSGSHTINLGSEVSPGVKFEVYLAGASADITFSADSLISKSTRFDERYKQCIALKLDETYWLVTHTL